MGAAARLNPRSFDGKRNQPAVLKARLARFVESFATREEFEQYVMGAGINGKERVYLETMLPERLLPQLVYVPTGDSPRDLDITIGEHIGVLE